MKIPQTSVKISALLRELKENLVTIYGDNLAGLYLYGSYARRDQDAESDIDIAIVLKDFRDYWEEIERTGQMISSLSLKFGVTLSPVRIKKKDWIKDDSPFLNNLRKESVSI